MEKFKAPEHHPFCWSYNRSIANRLGVDVERNSDGVPREKSGCESDQSGESFLVIALDRQRHPVKVLDVAEGLEYLHANYTIHGNLNGVDIFIGPILASPVTFG